MLEKKIDIEGYCDDCKINHNCINCSYMDELFFYNKVLLSIFDSKNNNKEKKEDISINKKENNYCGECGAPYIYYKGLCKNCYDIFKYKGEL